MGATLHGLAHHVGAEEIAFGACSCLVSMSSTLNAQGGAVVRRGKLYQVHCGEMREAVADKKKRPALHICCPIPVHLMREAVEGERLRQSLCRSLRQWLRQSLH